MKNDTQKPSKGRTILVVVLLVIIVACIFLIFMPSSGDSEDQADSTAQSTQESTQADASDESAEEMTESEPESEAEEDAGAKKSGSYDLDEMSIIYSDSVRDDKTGNWRLAKVTGMKSAEEYALDYYNEFFADDSELHAIVNFDLNTTACLTVISGNINVRIYEHVDGEEQYASSLFTGDKLAEYNVTIETGEIEQVE